MKCPLVFAAAFATGIVSGSALLHAAPTPATSSVLGKHDSNQPINIASDRFVADLNAKTGEYQGNVVVVQGDMKLRANTVRVTSTNGKADKVTAVGNVVVDLPASGTATGDNGVYSVGPRTVLMTGNVVLKKGKDVMRGAQMTVNLVTGQAVLGAGPKGTPGMTNGRVTGVFTPTTAPGTSQ